jgi:hypothetical protein
MSTKIMSELRKKLGKDPTKNDFDHAIAKLFDNAAPMVVKLAAAGKKPDCEIDYWHAPKVGTIFENVSDKTTFRFALKMIEGRERWSDIERKRAQENQNSKPKAYGGEAAKAIDRFNGWVEAANFTGPGANVLEGGAFPGAQDFSMKSYLDDLFDPSSDTDCSIDSGEELTDKDEALNDNHKKPADAGKAPAAKRIKLETSSATEGKASPNLVLGAATAPLTIRARPSTPKPEKSKRNTDANKLKVPSEPVGAHDPSSGPRFGNVSLGERLNLAERFAQPFKGPKGPDPEWDALLARASKPYGSFVDLDEDADFMDI